VKEWRDSGYEGAGTTSKSLLWWWFDEKHLLPTHNGPLQESQNFLAQQEALETVVYLCDVVGGIRGRC
jgi:type III restriction enzyme